MKKVYLLTLFIALFAFSANAQYAKVKIDEAAATRAHVDVTPLKSTVLTETAIFSANTDPASPDWNPTLTGISKVHELPEAVAREIERKTQEKIRDRSLVFQDEPGDSPLGSPILGNNFAGNVFSGMTPPDNSMAISNGGYIVSVVNSTIEYYTTGGTQLYSSSFANFFNNPGLTAMIYDPVVLYDSGSDRFFMAVLHGTSSGVSKVMVCFSKTNNPSDGWWYYGLTGNPLNNGCWFDYPKLGVSNNEVYVTGNLFSDGGTWNQSVIYQIPKAAGYSGGALNWQYWYNVSNSPFTMVPASYGQQGNYGPGIYLVATNENGSSDNYWFLDLTDDLSGNPSLNVSSITANFDLAGNALQNGTSVVLNSGDTRGLSAFYLPGMVHFAFTSAVFGNYCGLNYNRITVSSLTNWNTTFGLDGYDYSYPSIASFGTSTSDKSVIVGFLRSGSAIYPQSRVVYVDDGGTWSGSTLVKSGETFVNVYQSNGVTRWGDYSGVSRKQNASPPEVWLSGCYGAFQGGENALNTWIGQVTGVTTGIHHVTPKPTEVKLFPNPATNLFFVEFQMEKKSMIEVSVLNAEGKTVRLLLKDMANEGKNRFSFNKGPLNPGIYFLKISNGTNNLVYEKLVIE